MLKRRFYFLFLLLVPLSSSGVFAQYYLVLKKRTKIKYVFAAGDELKFKLHGEDFYNEQMIKGFGAEKIRFHYFDLALNTSKGTLYMKYRSFFAGRCGLYITRVR